MPTLYSDMRKKCYPYPLEIGHGFIPATSEEDKFKKIDAYYPFKDKGLIPFQLRAYDRGWFLSGFPVRDAALVNDNEWQLLQAGKLDSYYWVFAEYEDNPEPTPQREFLFRKIKITTGKSLRENSFNVIGERRFPDGHLTYIGDPPDTYFLRKWNDRI